MDILNGILRAVVPSGLAYAVGRGWISADSTGDIMAALTAIGAAAWSVWSKRK